MPMGLWFCLYIGCCLLRLYRRSPQAGHLDAALNDLMEDMDAEVSMATKAESRKEVTYDDAPSPVIPLLHDPKLGKSSKVM